MRAKRPRHPGRRSRIRSQNFANWGWTGPVWRLRRRMEIPHVSGPVVAFCGIARPEQFFAGLEAGGRRSQNKCRFADHYRYTLRDIERLVATAGSMGARAIITTEKDQVRLGSLVSVFPSSLPLKTARLVLSIEDESRASEWLVGRLGATRAPQSLVRKSNFANSVQVSFARGPFGCHGRHSPCASGRNSAAHCPSRMDH